MTVAGKKNAKLIASDNCFKTNFTQVTHLLRARKPNVSKTLYRCFILTIPSFLIIFFKFSVSFFAVSKHCVVISIHRE